MKLKIAILIALCLAASGPSRANLHGSGSAPITSCSGATNDLVFSNNCSGVYYPQTLL